MMNIKPINGTWKNEDECKPYTTSTNTKPNDINNIPMQWTQYALKELIRQVLKEEELKLSKYRKSLEEIKSLAELEVIIFDNKALFPSNIQRIIDKINEVLNEG